jgi:hypothetical protein
MLSVRTLRTSVQAVGDAVRHPERLAERWQHDELEAASPASIMVVLLANAAFGTAIYGITMQMHRGWWGMLEGAIYTPLAAGLAWTLAFPALYVVRRALGSTLELSSTMLAASITVSFGASAMLASVPINWFFTLSLPWREARWVVNLVVFTGVGFCMSDVFWRTMQTLDDSIGRAYSLLWLGLLAVIGMELFAFFGVFQF